MFCYTPFDVMPDQSCGAAELARAAEIEPKQGKRRGNQGAQLAKRLGVAFSLPLLVIARQPTMDPSN